MSSEKTRQYMVENCQACRDDMMREVNPKELVGSEIVIPNYIIEKILLTSRIAGLESNFILLY